MAKRQPPFKFPTPDVKVLAATLAGSGWDVWMVVEYTRDDFPPRGKEDQPRFIEVLDIPRPHDA